jgi:hypothetical protein
MDIQKKNYLVTQNFTFYITTKPLFVTPKRQLLCMSDVTDTPAAGLSVVGIALK